MPWTEVSPGRFTRPFSSLENFYRSIAAATAPIKREHFQIHTITQISPVPSPTELRDAWRDLRFRHPLLAGLDDGAQYAYEVPSASQLDAWLYATVHCFGADDPMTVDKLARSPAPSAGPEVFLLARTSEVVVRTSHWRIDGLGSMHLSNALLEALANPLHKSEMEWTSGQALPLLTPGIDEVIGAPGDNTPERVRKGRAMLGVMIQNQSTVAFETLPGELPGVTGRIQHRLSKEMWTRLLSGCKARGLTVTVGLHAALILAGQKLTLPAAQDSGCVYTDLITVSLRKSLPAPFNSSAVPLTLYHTGVPLTVTIPAKAQTQTQSTGGLGKTSPVFWHLATSVSQAYHSIQSTILTMVDYLPQWVNTIVAAFTTPPTPNGPPPPALPSLSSLGVVEDNIRHMYQGAKRFEVRDWACRVEMLDRHIQCHCWTWDGRVNMSALWNEAFYDKHFVEQLVQEWMAILDREFQ